MVRERTDDETGSYLHEPESFRPLAMVQDEQVYHYHLDHLGTPRELTSDAGDIVWKARYKTYGNAAIQAVGEMDNPIRFQGQYYDEESGLHYNRHRYYNPETGQFTTQDPIGLLGGLNNYQYAPNPMQWVDPLGLTCKEVVTYRGDTRDPTEIFEQGFAPRGTATDLYFYAALNEPSIYVSTSKSEEVAIDFATVYGTKNGNIYAVRSKGGIDVNARLGKQSPFPEEEEVAVPNGVDPSDVLGYTPVNKDGAYVGYSVLNPRAYR